MRRVRLRFACALFAIGAVLHARTGVPAEPLHLPIVGQPLTLTWYTGLPPAAAVSIRSLSEQSAYQVLAERTGIRIAFTHPPIGAEVERFNLLAVSGTYPDVIEEDWKLYPGGAEQALQDRFIIPLNDLIRRYAPNFQALLDANPDMRRQISSDDGTIYCFPLLRLDPQVRTIWGPQIRADWLDKAGLAVPTTMAEWHEVLTAFKTRRVNGRDDLIPYSAFNDIGDRSVPGLPPALWPFLGPFGLAPEFYQINGKVHYSPFEPAYRAFLATLHQWYAEGLLDADFALQNNKQFDAKMLNNNIGAYASFNGSTLGRFSVMSRSLIPNFRLVAAPFPAGTDGSRHITYPPAAQIFVGRGAAVSGQNAHVVETIKYLDYGYSREGGLALSFGKEGLSYTLIDGKPRYTDAVVRNSNRSIVEAIYQHARPQSGPLVQDAEYLTQFYVLPAQIDALKIWSEGSTDLLLPSLQIDRANARKFAALMSDINTYVAEMTVKFIVGRAALDDFDGYRSNLDRAGITRAIELMQNALDRYNAKPVVTTQPTKN